MKVLLNIKKLTITRTTDKNMKVKVHKKVDRIKQVVVCVYMLRIYAGHLSVKV
jgi:hypothetical protein